MGVYAVTLEILAIEAASAGVSDGLDPAAVIAPRLLEVPGETVITLVPRLEIVALIFALPPCVRIKAAMTSATPMKIPSAVNIERSRFAHKASSAIETFDPSFPALLKSFFL